MTFSRHSYHRQANYRLLQQLTALPLVDFPVLLENKSVALRCTVLWWEKRIPTARSTQSRA